MTLTTLVVTLLVIFVVGLAAYWIITKFIKEGQAQTITLLIVGAILLLILLTQFFPGVGNFRVWK